MAAEPEECLLCGSRRVSFDPVKGEFHCRKCYFTWPKEAEEIEEPA